MNKFEWFILLLLLITLFSSCKEYEINDVYEPSYRIKTIVEYDYLGLEQSKELFFYEDDQLIFLKSYTKNEGVFDEIQKVKFTYEGNNVTAVLSCKRNDVWNIKQTCKFTLVANLISEKIVSRNASPECNECWKYNYAYVGTNLLQWSKYIKDNVSGEWNPIRKVEYGYKNDFLNLYQDFVNYTNDGYKLDYKREYIVENNIVTGWLGGICREDYDWVATQKVEYNYLQNKLSEKKYTKRLNEDEPWSLFVKLNYYYDTNNNLIEIRTNSGSKTVYEYEEGSGNAALLYCSPESTFPLEPDLKGANIVN